MNTVIVIPALNPDEKLVSLVERLKGLDAPPIVVVDDGSAEQSKAVFQRLEHINGCIVCRHEKNLGKGAALKTGIRCADHFYPGAAGYVTADADGQHSAADILYVSSVLEKHPTALILGTRDFSGQDVPFRSRWGNRITSFVFRVSTGVRCPDTQTGLRGIPKALKEPCLAVPGERFEYEMNLLLAFARERVPMIEVPISTIYLEHNASTHFHPVIDSLRIYLNILRFGLSSLLAAAVDLTIFTLLCAFLFGRSSEGILAATVLARLLSGYGNFLVNRNWVFRSQNKSRYGMLRYLVLFLCQMFMSWFLVSRLAFLGGNITLYKIAVDVFLFIASYFVQKHLIFTKGTRKRKIYHEAP